MAAPGLARAGPPPETAAEESLAGKKIPPPRVAPQLAPRESSPVERLGLERQANGTYLYVDPHARFSAEFRTDGTVAFADPWRRPHPTQRDRGKCCGWPPGGFNPLMGASVTGPLEWLIYMSGADPLSRAKMELLEATLELRTQQAIEFARAQIRKRLGELEDDLRGIVETKDQSQSEARRVLFERWDECDEWLEVAPPGVPVEAVSAIDAERVDAALRARRRIEAFIRKTFPKSSPKAYTKTELHDLNLRRVSHEPFAPYTTPPRQP